MGKQARMKRAARRWIDHQRGKWEKKAERYQRRSQDAVVAGAEFLWNPQGRSPWAEAQEDKRDLLHQFDNYHGVREYMQRIAEFKSEWAGIPTPVHGEKLVIADGYPFKEAFEHVDMLEDEDGYAPREGETHTVFYAHKFRREIAIFRNATGKVVHWGAVPEHNPVDLMIRTMGCSVAWSIESEAAALQTLATLLPHHHFKYYLLTGSFIETSKRSGIRYIFRKLRPTIALSAANNQLTFIAALCLHPIGFYSESYAGSLCPTDDVLAHLLLMRSDEHFFWRKSNHHTFHDRRWL